MDLTLLFVLVPMLVGLMGAAMLLVLVLTLVRGRSRPAVPVIGPNGRPVAQAWNAEILGTGSLGVLGGSLAATYGVLTLDAGRLSFRPDGAAEPAWTVPCPEVAVRRQGVGPFAIGTVRLQGPMGDLACNLSREPINRFVRNSLKTMRESGYADQFVAAVHAHGARVA